MVTLAGRPFSLYRVRIVSSYWKWPPTTARGTPRAHSDAYGMHRGVVSGEG
jgi:hypothetical protein